MNKRLRVSSLLLNGTAGSLLQETNIGTGTQFSIGIVLETTERRNLEVLSFKMVGKILGFQRSNATV